MTKPFRTGNLLINNLKKEIGMGAAGDILT
jgi:hypothetical protein